MDSESTLGLVTVGLFFVGLALVTVRDLGAKRSPLPIAVIYVLALWPMVVNLNAPRYVTYDRYTGLGSLEMPEWPESLSVPALILTGLLTLYVLTRVLSRGWKLLPRDGLRVLVAYLLCVSAPVLAALAGSPGGGLTHALLRPHVMVSAVVLAEAQRPGQLLPAAKWGSLAWVVGSLAAAVVAPDWALFESGPMMDGPLPFPRLYGVCANPNGLAPIALLFLYLEYFIPSQRVVRVLGSALALAVIVMSQSKTTWGITLISAYVLYLYRKGASARAPFWAKLGSGAIVGVVAVAMVAGSGESVAGGIEVKTLTGRTELWAVAMGAWASSPVFGYGPTLWNEDFRAQFLRTEASYAGHAHNMYVQQLAESGLVGLASLLLFLGLLGRMAWSARHRSSGLSLAVLLNLVIAAVTESTMMARSMDQSMFGMGVFLALAIACSSPRAWRDTVTVKGAGVGARSSAFATPAT